MLVLWGQYGGLRNKLHPSWLVWCFSISNWQLQWKAHSWTCCQPSIPWADVCSDQMLVLWGQYGGLRNNLNPSWPVWCFPISILISIMKHSFMNLLPIIDSLGECMFGSECWSSEVNMVVWEISYIPPNSSDASRYLIKSNCERPSPSPPDSLHVWDLLYFRVKWWSTLELRNGQLRPSNHPTAAA